MGQFVLETSDPPAQSQDFAEKLEEVQLPEGATEEETAMLAEAKKAAVAVVESGVLGATGPEGDYYGVAFAGVSNPGHEVPAEGSNDRITIEVRKVAEVWPPEAAAAAEGGDEVVVPGEGESPPA